jgi:hypothetical protein
MASKDFIYDLLDKLEEERIEYLLFTLERKEQDGAGELYYNFYKEESKKDASRILSNLSKAVLEIDEGEENDINIEIEDDDEDENE